jgi:ethanolaminephosphotransferase
MFSIQRVPQEVIEKRLASYAYRCDDRAILLHPMKRWLATPLLRFIPYGLPANLITIFSCSLIWLVMWMVIGWDAHTSLRSGLIALCVLGYAVGDHLDGLQAKRTQTSSPLGEWFDHGLDIYNTGLVFYATCLFFRCDDIAIVGASLYAVLAAQTLIYTEQFKRSHLRFEELSSLESLFLIAGLYLSAIHPAVYAWWINPILWGYPPIYAIVAIPFLGGMVTLFQLILRMGSLPRPILLYLVIAALAYTAALLGFLRLGQFFLWLWLYNALFVGYLLRGHLIDGAPRFPDLIAPFLLLGGILWLSLAKPLGFSPAMRNLGIDAAWYTSLSWLILRCLWSMGSAIYQMRRFWFWWNPPPPIQSTNPTT